MNVTLAEFRSLERRVQDLERHVARLDLHPAGSGKGGKGIPYTEGTVFPVLPDSGIALFFHTVKTELFVAHWTDTHWYPVRKFFLGDGTPGSG